MNNFEDFHRTLTNFYSIPKESSIKIFNRLQNYSCEKEYIVTSEGEKESHIYFVLDGVLMSYFSKRKKEFIICFSYPPSVTGVLDSFISNTPSKMTIRSITSCEFLRISKEDFFQLASEDVEIERLLRNATNFALSKLVQQHYELMTLSIEERFKALANQNASLMQIVPQKYIASFLNMHPTNFSKLINKTRI